VDIRHLRYFQAVAEELNFSKAAERLHVAQPALSRAVKDLEEDLGVVLYHAVGALYRPHPPGPSWFMKLALFCSAWTRLSGAFNTAAGEEGSCASDTLASDANVLGRI
jgi:DNA-binding transcriptional LysR family regulator